MHDVVEPVLRALALQTGESASFYVREGNQRTCLVRVEGPQAIRHHVRVGAALPLDLGAPGRVILAFTGEPGEPYESIRQRGYHLSLGEREPEVSSVSAPVFGHAVAAAGLGVHLGPHIKAAGAEIAGSRADRDPRRQPALVRLGGQSETATEGGGGRDVAPVATQRDLHACFMSFWSEVHTQWI